jgi:hypothetical protein
VKTDHPCGKSPTRQSFYDDGAPQGILVKANKRTVALLIRIVMYD